MPSVTSNISALNELIYPVDIEGWCLVGLDGVHADCRFYSTCGTYVGTRSTTPFHELHQTSHYVLSTNCHGILSRRDRHIVLDERRRKKEAVLYLAMIAARLGTHDMRIDSLLTPPPLSTCLQPQP